jgi:glycosyltransferase involved in cell wall biosynthesis
MRIDNKIALFIPTLRGGGAERVFVNLANYFLAKGYIVYLLTTKEGVYFHLLNKNIRVIYFSISTNRILYYFLGIIQVSYFLLKHKPAILLTTLIEANLIGCIAKKVSFSKVILILRQANILRNITKSDNKYNKLMSWAFNNSNGIIANSPDTSISIQKLCNIKNDKIKIIANPVYSPNALFLAKEQLGINDNYILAVGSFKKQKDYPTLIKAFSLVRKHISIALIVLGNGPERNNIEELVKNLQLENDVYFRGFVNNPYPYFANAKLFTLSSIFEGFGNVLVESLSVGTPVVSTNCQGGPNYILENGKYGTLVPVGDYKMLAEGIIKTLESNTDKEFLINRAKEFSIEKIGDEYLAYFKDLNSKHE